MTDTYDLAVLMTCHNRSDKTLSCLSSLFAAEFSENFIFHVYLVDDGSTDHTGALVKKAYPQVNVIDGNGELYWCGGMRLAWKSASEKANYHFYLWLNDDVVLKKDFWKCLKNDYYKITENTGPGVLTGACADPDSGEFTYGGRDDKRLLPPNGAPQKCKYIHGNVVLVPDVVFRNVGMLSESFTHAMGDTDYGLRTVSTGFNCYTTSRYVATCRQHKIKGPWASSKTPLKNRMFLFTHPLGLNFKEYLIYRKRHWPTTWMFDILKVCIQVIFPRPFEFFSVIRLWLFNQKDRIKREALH